VFIGALTMVPAVAFSAGAISQAFPTGSVSIANGTILEFVSSGKVGPAINTGGSAALVGVAVNQPLVQLSGASAGSVQAAVSGTAGTLVSDINGPVKTGDRIAASPISGVGMKANDSGEVIGVAQSDLSSVATITQSVTDKSGQTATVHVGLIPVAVNVAYFTSGSGGTLSAFVPAFLQDLANAISGKQVSPLRVLDSILILIAGSIIVIVMLNTAIRSGIISIGRNPLAGAALRKGLVDVIIAALGVLLVTVTVVYAVLVG
jgi:hypothetical protein